MNITSLFFLTKSTDTQILSLTVFTKNPVLSSENEKTLQRYGENYKKWLETSKGKEETALHREHENYFRQKLSQQKVKK